MTDTDTGRDRIERPALSDVPIETIIEAVEGYVPHLTGRE